MLLPSPNRDRTGEDRSLATRDFVLPAALAVIENPTAEELQALAAAMPNARRTAHGNVNVQTRVLARSKASTYLVSDEPEEHHQTLTRAEFERLAALQDAYVAGQEM